MDRSALLAEAELRVRHMMILLGRMHEGRVRRTDFNLAAEYRVQGKGPPPDGPIRSMDEIRLDADCFYWIARRFLSTLDGMPGLMNKHRVKSIKDIRDHLVEHSDTTASGRSPLPSIGFGSDDTGPIVKPAGARLPGDPMKVEDPGVYVSARVLLDTVTPAVEAAVVWLQRHAGRHDPSTRSDVGEG